MSQTFLKRALRWAASTFLSRERRARLGRFLLNEALGDNDGNPRTNGEHALLDDFLAQQVSGRKCIAFDVGANVGDWSRYFLAQALPSARVLAFEPASKTFERLCTNLKSDGRAQCVNAALSDHEGEAPMHVAAALSGTNSLYRRDLNEKNVSTESVRLETGDGFCSRQGIQQIDFLKIDAEGHELAVLNGFKTMLSERRIAIIQFEYGGTWLDARTRLADAFEFLLPKGYLIAKIFPEGLQFIDAYSQKLDAYQYANFVALTPEWKDKFRRIK